MDVPLGIVDAHVSSRPNPDSTQEHATAPGNQRSAAGNTTSQPASWLRRVATTVIYPLRSLQTIGAAVLYPKLQALWARPGQLFSVTLAILTFTIACLALWPTISGAKDSKTATLLAEWTAKKEYYEFCESHNWALAGCDDVQSHPPGPPPALDPRQPGDNLPGPGLATQQALATGVCLGTLLISTLLISALFLSLRNVPGSYLTVFAAGASGFFTTSFFVSTSNAIMPALAYVYPGWTSERYLTATISSLFGTLSGMVLFGFLADLFGRRSVYGLELAILVVATVGISTASPGIVNSMDIHTWMVFWRFFLTLSLGAQYPLSAVILVESASTEVRTKLLAAAYLTRSAGHLFANGVSLLVSDVVETSWQLSAHENNYRVAAPAVDMYWRLVIFIGSLPALISAALRFWVKETPLWLVPVANMDTAAGRASRATQRARSPYTRPEQQARETKYDADDETEHWSIWRHLGRMFSYLLASDRKNLEALLRTMAIWFILDAAWCGFSLGNQQISSLIWPSPRASASTSIPYDKMWGPNASEPNIAIFDVLKQNTVRNIVEMAAPAVAESLGFLLVTNYIPRVTWLRYWFLLLGGIFLISGTIITAGFKFDMSVLVGMLYVLARGLFSLGPYTIRFITPAELFHTKYRATFYAISSSAGMLGVKAILTISGNFGQDGSSSKFVTLFLSLGLALLAGALVTRWWVFEMQDRRRHSFADDDDVVREEIGRLRSRLGPLYHQMAFSNLPLKEIGTDQSPRPTRRRV